MDNFATILYFEINAFCILILLHIGVKSFYNVENRKNLSVFRTAIAAIIIFIICDTIWILISDNIIKLSISLNYILNIIYFISGGVVSYGWFIYSESVQDSDIVKNKKYLIFSTIPLIVVILLTIASYKTGWIFFVDENNIYHRGKLFYSEFVLTLIYIAFTSIKAFIRAFEKQNYVRRNEYMALGAFAFAPAVSVGMQFITGGTPIINIAITYAALIVHDNAQEQLISIDPLTKINNRNQMINFLSGKINYFDKSKNMYILMMDVDYFKQINDQYGHVVGDDALVRVADVLKKVSSEIGSCFISRYGGDEFIIICEADKDDDIEKICSRIHELIAEDRQNVPVPYELKVSIGYAKYDGASRYIPEIIAQADAELYKIKHRREENGR